MFMPSLENPLDTHSFSIYYMHESTYNSSGYRSDQEYAMGGIDPLR